MRGKVWRDEKGGDKTTRGKNRFEKKQGEPEVGHYPHMATLPAKATEFGGRERKHYAVSG